MLDVYESASTSSLTANTVLMSFENLMNVRSMKSERQGHFKVKSKSKKKQAVSVSTADILL